MRWTDDTQMSLDMCASLIEHGDVDPDDLALRFAQSYRWSRGYGPAAAKLLKRVGRGTAWHEANRSVYPEGSFGNGGAMRAPVVGLAYAARLDALPAAARDSARVTHAHPLGLEGAILIAAATAQAVTSPGAEEILTITSEHATADPYRERLEVARTWIDTAQTPGPSEVRHQLGNGIAAADSCVTSVYVAARFLGDPFPEMIAFIAACGGDVDTIGAMAGAIWGAANAAGALPPESLAKLESAEAIRGTACALHAKCAARAGQPRDRGRDSERDAPES